VRLIALLTVPAAIILFVLRRAIVGAFLQHGEYTPAAADNTSRALAGFALGLVGFSLYLFALRGFYAHQDTRTPFVINVVECVLNIGLAFLLVPRYDILGLAAAFAIANVVGAVWALQVLSYKVPGFRLHDVLGNLWPMVVAGVLAAEVMWLVATNVGGNVGGEALLRLVAGAFAGLAVYVAVLVVLRVPEVTMVRDRLRPVGHSTSGP
jgi:putative peptidoglycan lipid II flippase